MNQRFGLRSASRASGVAATSGRLAGWCALLAVWGTWIPATASANEESPALIVAANPKVQGDEPGTSSEKAIFPSLLVQFTPAVRNPVFTGSGPGHWDAKIRERGWILREGDVWRMWYTGYDGTREGIKRLGHAESKDGIAWTRSEKNPLVKDRWVEDMMVVRQGDKYYMFAEGERDRAQWLTSSDGLTWEPQGTLDIRRADGSAIPDGPFGTPTVWVEGEDWYLFYESRDAGVWLARTRDLRVWTHVQDEPVLSPGPGEYDKLLIALNQIVRFKGRYYAWYHGTGDAQSPRTWHTCLAVSDDLRHWTKFERNPIVLGNRSSGIVVPLERGFRLYTMHESVELFEPAKAIDAQESPVE